MSTPEQRPLVYVVDDDPEICIALALMLEHENLEVMTFECAEDFHNFYLEIKDSSHIPKQKCAIFDFSLPGIDGLQLQKILNDEDAMLPIVFLTGHGDIGKSVQAIKAGAENFLTKPVSKEKLMGNVHAALQKSLEWHNQYQEREAARKRLNSLTPRELEVLAMTLDGLPIKSIASRLEISPRTVEHHKTNILNKTETTSSIELMRLVMESGMAFV